MVGMRVGGGGGGGGLGVWMMGMDGEGIFWVVVVVLLIVGFFLDFMGFGFVVGWGGFCFLFGGCFGGGVFLDSVWGGFVGGCVVVGLGGVGWWGLWLGVVGCW
uniref:NADH dehydrogenase subunit 6 n=1 Tax=Knipowitschia caucasica TaxID=637954 RepID=A0AAV2LWL4_KNICA